MKKIVIGWGRMNPITTGHELLVNKIKSVAKSMGAEAAVYLTHSHDSKKNPLDYGSKVGYARKAFGAVVRVSPHKNIIDVMKSLKGYDEVTVVVGSDRVLEFKSFLNKYNNKEFKIKKLDVVSAGERDPDADDVSGMSASKMRALAAAQDLNGFRAGLPERLRSSAAAVMKKVRKGLMMEDVDNNEVESVEEGLDYAQRRRRAQVFKKYSAKIGAARRRALSRSSTNKTIMKRSRREAIGRMKARLARGRDVSTLSSPEKARIEDIIARRKKAIVRLATRLQPVVRKREKMRLSGSRHGGTINPFAEEVSKKDAEVNTKTKKTVHKDINNKKYLEFYNADSMKEEFNEFLLTNGFFSEDELVDVDLGALVEEIFSEGLWANIHAKRERIKRGSGERMRKPGEKGAPSAAALRSAREQVEHELDESESALAKKAAASGVSLGTLKKVYSRGVAAWRTGHRPGTTPQQWGMARVNSYITKGKTYHTADKDLREEKFGPVKRDKESGLPKGYTTGKPSTDKARAAHFKKGAKKHWDDRSAYKPAPGDATAKTRESKYTKKYKRMYEEE